MMLSMLLSALSRLVDLDDTVLGSTQQPSTLVMLSAPWCEPCKMLEPHLEQMQKKLNLDGVSILVGVLDAERYAHVADELSVSSFPSFVFYPNPSLGAGSSATHDGGKSVGAPSARVRACTVNVN